MAQVAMIAKGTMMKPMQGALHMCQNDSYACTLLTMMVQGRGLLR